jgi:hypothetical protein
LGRQGRKADVSLQFPGMIVSYTKIMGIDAFYHTADCIVFGWRLADSY